MVICRAPVGFRLKPEISDLYGFEIISTHARVLNYLFSIIQATQIKKTQERIFFYLRPFRINFTLPGRPSSSPRHSYVVEYSEVAESIHART